MKPEISAVIRQDIELSQRGKDLWGRCPFHEERTPSFKVSLEHQRFHCFGCGVSGDVIEYVMRRRGIDFKQASELLKIRSFKPTREEIEKKRLVVRFREWCRLETLRILNEWRLLWEITQDIKSEEDMNLRAWAYHDMADLEGLLYILRDGTDEQRYGLYRKAV